MRQLSRNVIYSLVGQILLIGLSIVATRYIYQRLGDEVMGLVYFSSTLSVLINAATLNGINKVVITEIARSHKSENAYVKSFFQTANTLYWSISIIAVGGVIIFSPWIVNDWIQLHSMEPSTAIQVIVVLALGTLINLPSSLYSSVLRAMEDMGYENIVTVASMAVRQFGLIALLLMGGNTMSAIGWMTICTIVPAGLLALRLKRYFPWQLLLTFGWQRDIFRRNRATGGNMLAITILYMFRNQADKVVVSAFLPIGFLGYYSFLSQTVSRTGIIQTAISTAALPRLSSSIGEGKQEYASGLHSKLEELQTFGMLPLYAALGFCLVPLLTYMFSAEVASAMLIPGIILLISASLSNMSVVSTNFALASRRVDIITRTNIYAVVVTLPLSIVLIRWYGITGAGISTLVGALFIAFYQTPTIYKECLGLSRGVWAAKLLRIVLLMSCTYGLAAIVLWELSASDISSLATAYLIATVLFLVGSFFLIDQEVRKFLITIVFRIFSSGYRFMGSKSHIG